MKVLNLLSAGAVGGIEQLCENIGRYAEYDNTFCFLFYEGQIYDEMIENKFSVVSLAKIGKGKFNKKRWSKLCEIVEKHDIVVTHHCTIALHAYYCLLTYKYKNKKFVSTIHSCYEKKYNLNYNSLLKNFLAYNFIKLMIYF